VSRISFRRSERTWASSPGGPGLNFEEHIAGRSRLGTEMRVIERGGERGLVNTEKALIWQVKLWFCYLGFDPTHDRRVAHPYEGGSICGRYRT
jgi:hypothetical protein